MLFEVVRANVWQAGIIVSVFFKIIRTFENYTVRLRGIFNLPRIHSCFKQQNKLQIISRKKR